NRGDLGRRGQTLGKLVNKFCPSLFIQGFVAQFLADGGKLPFPVTESIGSKTGRAKIFGIQRYRRLHPPPGGRRSEEIDPFYDKKGMFTGVVNRTVGGDGNFDPVR